MAYEMSNTKKMFSDFIDMILEANNITITKWQKCQIITNCFENDTIFDTLYEQVFDEIENVIGSIEG